MSRRFRSVLLCLAAFAIFCCAAFSAANAQSVTKAIVVAWDGAVPAFVYEMLREGQLPNLAKLIEGGAFADDVKAVFPSKTAPGFASLMTGAPPRVTGISGNRVPRAPSSEFTILESFAGFSEAPLHAEPIWSAALRAGKKSVVSHIPAFAGELSEQVVRFSGYTLIAGRDGIVTKRSIQSESLQAWKNLPASQLPPIEIVFSVAETRFYGLLIDDPADTQSGYDTLLIATEPDAQQIKARLKPAAAGNGRELFWSNPVAVAASGNREAKVYFRLFDLKPDGSDLFLYYTRPVRDLAVPKAAITASMTARTFIGNGASILYHQGAFGKTIPNGGLGAAEARYLETVVMAQHQLMETNRWAIEQLPWDLFLAYTPFPDEAEHLWQGYLDPTLATYKPRLAAELRPLLRQVYRTCDDFLGLLLDKRPPNTLFALISDHGMQGISKRIALNRVLQENGLLVMDAYGKVDLTKTRVIYPSVNNGYLLINSTERKSGIVPPEERSVLVGRIRDLLRSIRDGDRSVVKAVHDADVDGRALGIGGSLGGDLYIDLAPGYDFDPRIGPGPVISEVEPYGNHGANPEEASMRTLMVFNGPGIRAGRKLAHVQIIDFAPTLAALLHLPQPKDAGGRVLSEALDQPR